VTRHLIVYSKPDCPLCDALKAQLDSLGARDAFDIEIVDITTDARLEADYGHEVPVLLVDGHKAAASRIEDAALMRILETG
jgi:glutaredoxin|tara:strand:+ start:3192 stop:3434 length:243 start_codon:yes stop_codon:yes gene_type:complete